jgi:hypothetical protein
MFDAALMAATLSCALVTGFVFGFAVVVMPDITTSLVVQTEDVASLVANLNPIG